MTTDDSSEQVSLSGLAPSKRTVLKSDDAIRTFRIESDRILERLVSASIEPSLFWNRLVDEVVSQDDDEPLTPQCCEIALLRSGQSQLQSEQAAAAIFRSLNTCGQVLKTDLPRLAEQLRLRYAPLKQAFDAYGPGMLRAIGDQIWNGSAPNDWWPNKVIVHAVQPLHLGAAGNSTCQPSVWIEAVLTDISPDVPEWLRLVYQLTELAIDTHTRTHASNASEKSSQNTTELPWSLAIVPLIIDLATARGLLGNGPMPILQAIQLWHPSKSAGLTGQSDVNDEAPADNAPKPQVIAARIEEWWQEVGSDANAFPIALKDLANRLERSDTASNLGDV